MPRWRVPAGPTRPALLSFRSHRRRNPRRQRGRTVRQTAELIQLHADIDQRVGTIRDGQPDWLCAKGCDTCCRRLASVPGLTAAEWALLRDGLAALPPAQLDEIRRRVAVLAAAPVRPVVCPMLDDASGACPVYLSRPVACRTYGFYVERDKGLYCHDIESQEAAGKLAGVVWGNHEAVDRRLAALGQTRPLTDWFADWADDSLALGAP